MIEKFWDIRSTWVVTCVVNQYIRSVYQTLIYICSKRIINKILYQVYWKHFSLQSHPWWWWTFTCFSRRWWPTWFHPLWKIETTKQLFLPFDLNEHFDSPLAELHPDIHYNNNQCNSSLNFCDHYLENSFN